MHLPCISGSPTGMWSVWSAGCRIWILCGRPQQRWPPTLLTRCPGCGWALPASLPSSHQPRSRHSRRSRAHWRGLWRVCLAWLWTRSRGSAGSRGLPAVRSPPRSSLPGSAAAAAAALPSSSLPAAAAAAEQRRRRCLARHRLCRLPREAPPREAKGQQQQQQQCHQPSRRTQQAGDRQQPAAALMRKRGAGALCPPSFPGSLPRNRQPCQQRAPPSPHPHQPHHQKQQGQQEQQRWQQWRHHGCCRHSRSRLLLTGKRRASMRQLVRCSRAGQGE